MSKPKRELFRNSSICPTPEEILLESVKNNDSNIIQTLIESNRDLLKHEYNDDDYLGKTIVEIVCADEDIELKTLQTILNFVGNISVSVYFEALFNTDHLVLKEVLLRYDVVNFKNHEQENGLLYLIKIIDDEVVYLPHIKILLDKGVDAENVDFANRSAIWHAASKSFKQTVKLLVEKNVDLDRKNVQNDKTARKLIEEKHLFEGDLPPPKATQSIDVFFLIKNGTKEDEDTLIALDLEPTIELLKESCEKGLSRIFIHLYEKKPSLGTSLAPKNDNKCIVDMEKKTLLQNDCTQNDDFFNIAALNGHHEIFKFLLKQEIKITPTIITNLIKNQNNQQNTKTNYDECLKCLLTKLETLKSDPNPIYEENEVSNTPLYYAVRYGSKDLIHELLKYEPSLVAKNTLGFMPLEFIEAEDLEAHLDNCIAFDSRTKTIDKQDAILNYKTLMPQPPGNVQSDKVLPEMDAVAYMCRSPKLKHLIKHPVIVAFLFMKWYRIRWLFYTNCAFYMAFVASLFCYIYSYYGNCSDAGKNSVAVASMAVLSVTLVALILRELFQVSVSPITYFRNFENYVELVLIGITLAILLMGSPSMDTRKQLAAIAILLSAFELVLMLGQHPQQSTNVVMFRTVSWNFFKLLLWSSLMIIAFAFSFNILFAADYSRSVSNATTPDEDDYSSFKGPGESIFKTIVMLTGEFDAGNINFRTYPVSSKIIFSLFVFIITIILLNLLNGLAVSDIQTIKNAAELVGLKARAQHIEYVENMLLGNISPSAVLKFLQSWFCCMPRVVQDSFILQPLASHMCLFYGGNNNFQLKLERNREDISVFFNSECKKSIQLNKMSKQRIEDIERKKREENIERGKVEIEAICKKVEDMDRKLEEILKLLK